MATTHSIGAYRVSDSVLNAVRDASRRTGADFDYMLAQAAQESGFSADAEAETSSATGLYQFIETTWLEMVRDHGDRHGLGSLARQVGEGPDGQPSVADPAMRRRILDLRRDPRLNAVMAGEFANANRRHLERTVGGEIGSTELYLAHFLGADGATRFLNAMRAAPDRPAADLFPAAARANPTVFLDPIAETPRSLRAIHDRFDRTIGGMQALRDQIPDPGTPPRRRGWEPASPVASGPMATPSRLAAPAAASGRAALSLWTLLYLNALPPPDRSSSPPNAHGRADRHGLITS